MAKHNNPTISQDLLRIFNFKQGDMLGNDVGNMIVPVINVERFVNISRDVTVATNALTTVYTTPTDKDFYLSAACLTYHHDAACTTMSCNMSCFPDNDVTARKILIINPSPSAVSNMVVSNQYRPHIKIKRGTNISIQSANNDGVQRLDGSIQGFTIETTA